VSSENAANAGKIVGTANAIYNLSAKSDARDAVAKNAISAEATRLETNGNAVVANLRVSSRDLSAKYGWTPGEAGFDGVSSASLADQITRSPRDPFLRVREANAILDSAKNSNDTVPAINDYLTAARLVPADSVYNAIKLEFVEYAMEAAVDGAGLDVGASYSAHTMPNANALMASRTYLSVDPDDKTGVGHANLARAFAFAGRYQEAAYSAQAAMNLNQNWKSDPAFCIRYSKIESLNGDLDIALAALKHSYEAGYSSLKDVRNNPDFQALRTQRPQQFTAFTTLRWGWNIKFGSLVPDDVIIQNNSAFDLTHVKLNVHLRQDQQVWDKQLTCDTIKSGQSCTIENAFYISGSRLDESTANLSSDQN
jgi:tetratricopeptide (TPR) repeat protein